jgi:ribosomal protein S18 acetylase RimI-like enzyme
MTLPIRIREFCFPADYEPVFALWRSIERGVHTGRSDTPAEIEKKLARDPDLFLVAEADGVIIGSVIGGYDGRRGLVYHLAVASAFRGRGIGSQLMGHFPTGPRAANARTLRGPRLQTSSRLRAGLWSNNRSFLTMNPQSAKF